MLFGIAAVILETALFDDVLFPFLKSVHAKIVAANPDLAATAVILTSEPVPNAFSVGDGTLVVYTGLISELDNEDQLAFVLCHELAHYALHHATRQLVQEIERFQSVAKKAGAIVAPGVGLKEGILEELVDKHFDRWDNNHLLYTFRP